MGGAGCATAESRVPSQREPDAQRSRPSKRRSIRSACCLSSPDSQRQLFDEFEALLGAYPAVIVDLGVTRLDARMLPLARSNDPILMVVRQGHTERREVATTASALRAARRSVAGVILNDATDPVAKPLRRRLGK